MRLSAAPAVDAYGYTGDWKTDIANPMSRQAEERVAAYFRRQGFEVADEAGRHLAYDFTMSLPGDLSRAFTVDCKLDTKAWQTGNLGLEKSIQWPRGRGQHTMGWGLKTELDWVCICTPSPTQAENNLPWPAYLVHLGEYRQYHLALGRPMTRENVDGSKVYFSLAPIDLLESTLVFFRKITLPPVAARATALVALPPPVDSTPAVPFLGPVLPQVQRKDAA